MWSSIIKKPSARPITVLRTHSPNPGNRHPEPAILFPQRASGHIKSNVGSLDQFLDKMIYLRNILRLGTIALTLLVIYSTASPTSPQNGGNLELSPARRNPSRSELRRAVPRTSRSSSRTTRDLQRRDWMISYFDDGWKIYFSTYQAFLTIVDAGAALKEFFWAVIDMSTGPWLHEEPLKDFSITLGRLALDFKTDAIAIPWQSVAGFAQTMLYSVQAGFIGAFDVMLENTITNTIIYVKLRTLSNVAPAA